MTRKEVNDRNDASLIVNQLVGNNCSIKSPRIINTLMVDILYHSKSSRSIVDNIETSC